MNQKALKTLEFDKIIHRLTEHAASVGAKKKCTELVPVTSLWEIERAQDADRRRASPDLAKGKYLLQRYP